MTSIVASKLYPLVNMGSVAGNSSSATDRHSIQNRLVVTRTCLSPPAQRNKTPLHTVHPYVLTFPTPLNLIQTTRNWIVIQAAIHKLVKRTRDAIPHHIVSLAPHHLGVSNSCSITQQAIEESKADHKASAIPHRQFLT